MDTSSALRKRAIVSASVSAAVLGVMAFHSGTASAANGSWTGLGADSSWSTALNWTGATPPGTGGQIATFSGAGNSKTTIDLGAGINVSNIVFDTASAAAYTIGAGAVGSQTLTLNANVTMNAAVVTNQLFNSAILLNATNTFTNNSTTNSLTLAGPVSATAGTRTFALAGAGNTIVNGSVSNGAGTVSITKAGAGTATFNGGVAVPVTVSGGTLQFGGGTSALGAAFNFTAPNTTVAVSGGTLTVPGVTSSGNSTSRVLAISGTGVLRSSGDLFVSGSAAQISLSGGGTLASINAAGITLNDADTGIAVGAGGGVLDVASGNITSNVAFSSFTSGASVTVSGAGTLKSAVNIISQVALQNNATWDTNGLASAIGALSGTAGTTATNTGAAQVLTLNINSGNQTYNGVIAGGANLSILKTTNGGTQTLAGVNTFSGGTVVNGGTIATTGAGTLGAGNVTLADTAGVNLVLGNSASIADAATLSFGPDATITLDFAGADLVGAITNSVTNASIGAGIHSAGDLNTFFGVSSFSGTGSLQIIPEPVSLGVFGLAIGGMLGRRRRNA